MKTVYPAVVHEDADGIWVEFPDLPGCCTDGESVPDAITNAVDALGAYLCSMSDRAIPYPAASNPRSLEAAAGFVTMIVTDPVRYKKNTRAVKKTLTIPEWLNVAAEKAGINFSQLLQESLCTKLGV